MRLPGCTLSLPASIQAEIAELVRSAARYGFGLLRDDLRLFIADFVTSHWNDGSHLGHNLRRHCHFVNKTPGDKLYQLECL